MMTHERESHSRYVKVEFTLAMDPIVISSLSDLIRQYDRYYKANGCRHNSRTEPIN